MKEINLSGLKDCNLCDTFKKSPIYQQLVYLSSEITCETSYPASILDGIQTGRIFVDDTIVPQAAIFWHYCGIAYVTGKTKDSEFIQALYTLLDRTYEPNQRSFYLIIAKETCNWITVLDSFHERNPDIQKRERFSFIFNHNFYQKSILENNITVLPEGFSYFEIQSEHLLGLSGRVIPSYSWDNNNDFFNFGKGFGIYDVTKNRIASTSFSSGIGDGKIDIGIETQPDYRRMGFATLCAARMVRYVLEIGMLPDWGCDTMNQGSASTAIKIGFEKSTTYSVYTKL
ncbi:MAG: GNAT family N-acetyltransferase [Clostridiales bacterium]|nr:GNAT family N-acetyltransferase [Clostridiales bacterium]